MSSNIPVFYTREGYDIYEDRHKSLLACLSRDYNFSHFVKGKRITMVGRYYLHDENEQPVLWCSLPKYSDIDINDCVAKNKDADACLDQLIKVFDKLRREGRNIDDEDPDFEVYNTRSELKRASIFSTADYIVRDYCENGLYVRQKVEYGSHLRGKTSWSRTIKKEHPLISGHSVIYDRIWKKHNVTDDTNIITQLHASILLEAIDVMGLKGNRPDVKLPYGFENIDLTTDKKKRAAVLLRQELSQVFTDRDVNLLKALIAWCDDTNNYKFAGCVNTFDRVWEWVNDAVFGNVHDNDAKKSEDLTYYLYQDKDKIGYKCPGQNSQIDTLYYNPDNKQLLVYDAKYYCPEFVENGHVAKGVPDNKDSVRKQVIYFEGLKQDLGPKNVDEKISKNIFLLPWKKEYKKFDPIRSVKYKNMLLYDHIGYVESPGFGKLAERLVGKEEISHFRVELYMVHPDGLYGMYLKSLTYDHENEYKADGQENHLPDICGINGCPEKTEESKPGEGLL